LLSLHTGLLVVVMEEKEEKDDDDELECPMQHQNIGDT
jgi:hypothetical protein